MDGRSIFVGDIQGCADELATLLATLDFQKGCDQLYSVGDVLGRGPASLRVLQLLQDYEASVVLGNHEAFLLRCGFFDADRLDPEAWPALEDLAASAERRDFGAWIRDWPLFRSVETGGPACWLVHAAVPRPLWQKRPRPTDLERLSALRYSGKRRLDPEGEFLIHARYCDADGQRPERDWPVPEAPFAPWDEHYKGERIVVCGHWARRGLFVTDRIRALDSGCVYGKELTAWIAEEDRVEQVPARQCYWPRDADPS